MPPTLHSRNKIIKDNKNKISYPNRQISKIKNITVIRESKLKYFILLKIVETNNFIFFLFFFLSLIFHFPFLTVSINVIIISSYACVFISVCVCVCGVHKAYVRSKCCVRAIHIILNYTKLQTILIIIALYTNVTKVRKCNGKAKRHNK